MIIPRVHRARSPCTKQIHVLKINTENNTHKIIVLKLDTMNIASKFILRVDYKCSILKNQSHLKK